MSTGQESSKELYYSKFIASYGEMFYYNSYCYQILL